MIHISKPIIEDKEIEATVKVLRSGMIAQGAKVKELENNFADYCGTKYAVAFNSGTAAIHGGLYALGISEGDEVITTPFSFIATASPILMQKAKVVFADIAEDDFNLSPEEIAQKITAKTKAILPVDLYGQIHKHKKIKAIAEKNNLKILTDACQSIGARYENAKAGSLGDISAFSLYATKNIMCGEGGIITTNTEEYMEKCKLFRHHGQSEKTRYEYKELGYNYRLTDLAASIALVQLGRLEYLTEKRIENALKYQDELSNIQGLILPQIKKHHRHVFHQYTIRITPEFKSDRSSFIEYLKEKGIGSGIYYPKPLHRHPIFLTKGYKKGDFPVAEKLANEVLSLPVHPSISEKEIDFIIKTIQNYAK